MEIKQIMLQVFQFQFNCGPNRIVPISYSKLVMAPHAYRLAERTFGTKMETTERFQFHMYFKTIETANCIINPSVLI